MNEETYTSVVHNMRLSEVQTVPATFLLRVTCGVDLGVTESGLSSDETPPTLPLPTHSLVY